MAKKEKIYKGGKPKLFPSQVQDPKAGVEKGVQKAKIVSALNISREILYQYLKKPEIIPVRKMKCLRLECQIAVIFPSLSLFKLR